MTKCMEIDIINCCAKNSTVILAFRISRKAKSQKEVLQNMAKYETMMVTTANLDEEASNALINKFKNLIAANGTIDSVDDWGKKRLAYPINDETEGVYTVINFTSEPDFPAELDRVFKITEGVLRSMTLAVEE